MRRAFETGALPNSAFHHRDHIRLAWIYLRRDGPETGAREVIDGIRQEKFLILPHPEVAEYFQRKATDYDRWLNGMRRMRKRVLAASS